MRSSLKFSNNFKNKYNLTPSMYASKGYELAKVIIELLKMGNETELKKNLLKIKEFSRPSRYYCFLINMAML
ncbi:MAG: hypothetical protein U5K55_12585 [Aliarcobacter sp.]|nr:hypothetical protein [Aliarcobacter sp.]